MRVARRVSYSRSADSESILVEVLIDDLFKLRITAKVQKLHISLYIRRNKE